MKKQMGIIAAAVSTALSAPLFAQESPVSISGLVEVEASSVSDKFSGTTVKNNDVALATVELAIDASISDRVDAFVAFLYEEDATDFSLDEGTLSLKLSDSVALTAGRTYVPFGKFDSYMVSDPLTLDLAETSETVLMLSAESNGLYGAAFLFNGDSDKADMVSEGNDDAFSFGLNAGYAREDAFEVGASYISNLGDTDTLQGLEGTMTAYGVVDKAIAGANLYFNASFGPVTIIAEHVRALDSFTNGDLDGTVSNEEQPRASHVELAYAATDNLTLAATYQCSKEALFIGLPEKVTAIAASYGVMEGATLSAEYASIEDYGSDDGGSGEKASAITLQLAVEF